MEAALGFPGMPTEQNRRANFKTIEKRHAGESRCPEKN
jgi:hypothetical protein